jgi:hypothetical protein
MFAAGTTHLLQRLRAGEDRLQQGAPFVPVQLVLREGAQVEVLPVGHEGARRQRGHFAVTHVGPPGTAEGLLHLLDDRDVQRIVGRIAGHDNGDQRHAQRIEDASSDFQLRPGGVVLAVAELHQPLLGHDVGVGIGGGGVDAHRVGGELVDADGLLVQLPFQVAEGIAAAQTVEPVGQSVVLEIDGPDRFAEQGGEDALVLGDPGLDVVEAVVALGEDEQQPDGQDLAWGQGPFPQTRRGKEAVQGGRQVQTLQRGPQDWQVSHDLNTHEVGFDDIHPSILPASPFLENHPDHERTAG